MPRRHQNIRRYSSESDREKRSGKLIKAFRTVDPENSLEIYGCIRDLVREESLPPMSKIPASHQVFILDPRIVRREFTQGFAVGFDFARTKERIRTGSTDFDNQITAHTGEVDLLGIGNSRKHLIVSVENEEVKQERLAIYAMLGEAGLRGFLRKTNDKPPAPILYLGQFEAAITDQEVKDSVIDVVETSFAIHQAHKFTLGELKVVG